ncbi:MAG: hypothetical protein JSR62_04570 [Nitrospira sp.]|nr:hypothetical protein [Nitrospira sp.]
MAFKGDDSTLSLATTVTLALAVAAMVFVKNPLQSSRPTGNGPGLHQTTGELKVPARLWEDPFGAVEKAVEASRQHSVQVSIDGRQVNVTTSSVSPQALPINGLDRLHQKIQDIDARGERILALIVMTQGGWSVEAVENRIRDRYAVGAALEVGCFAPDKGESLSYFLWDFPTSGQTRLAGGANRSAKLSAAETGPRPPQQYTPYEWYSRNPIWTCPGSNLSPQDRGKKIDKVLVLWTKAQEDEDRILTRIDEVLSKLDIPTPQDKNKKLKLPLQVKFIGPRTSSEFRRMLEEIEKRLMSQEVEKVITTKYRWQGHDEGLHIYSPWATAPPGLLAYGLRDQHKAKDTCTSYVRCGNTFDLLMKSAGLHASYRVTSDEVLFASLLEELERRQVTIGQDRIVLIEEWDSFYARALPYTFLGAAYRQFQNNKNEECKRGMNSSRFGAQSIWGQPCLSIDDGITRVISGNLSPEGLNIMRYSYLSGLDGDASEERAKRVKPKEDDKEKDRDRGEGRRGFRDIDSYERPEGMSQLDYVRRLVARIKAESEAQKHPQAKEGEQKSGKVKAIGILGRDTYDALLILQAVREQFPNTIFFATDLDARYFHEDEQKWTRNLIVASQFGLQLESTLQQSIPPFRNSLQTSAFFAVLQAIGGVTPQLVPEAIPPRIFEIGRHGAVDLSVDNSPYGMKTIHPARVDIADDKKAFKFPPRVERLLITATVLVGLVFWGWGNLWNWLMGRGGCNRHIGMFKKSNRLAWALLLPILVGFFVASVVLQHNYVEDEPFSWFDGVSLWPTELLRLLATALCLMFMIKGYSDSVRNRDHINDTFFQTGPSCNIGESWRSKLGGFWRNLDWMFHGTKKDSSVNARTLWNRYCLAHTAPQRAARIAMEFLLYIAIMFPLLMFMNDGEWRLFVPCRGEFSCKIDFMVTQISVLSFIILNLAVLDAVILCTRWVREVPATNDLFAMKQIHLIVERTRIVNRRILYPFIALFLVIAARSHYFDNWDFPPVLILALTVNSLVAIASATMLYLTAVEAKRRILEPLQHQLDDLASSADRAASADQCSRDEALRRAISDIDSVQQGAFVPFYQQPMVQATLVAALAFLQYWYLGQ